MIKFYLFKTILNNFQNLEIQPTSNQMFARLVGAVQRIFFLPIRNF